MLLSKFVLRLALVLSFGGAGHIAIAQEIDPTVFSKIEPPEEGIRIFTETAEIRKLCEQYLVGYRKLLDSPHTRAFEYTEIVYLDDSDKEPQRRKSHVFCAEDHEKRLLHISRRIIKEQQNDSGKASEGNADRRKLDRVRSGSVWLEYDDGRYLSEDNHLVSVNRAAVPRLLGYLPPEHLALSLATGVYARPVDVEAVYKTLHKEISKVEVYLNGDVAFHWVKNTLHYSIRFQKNGKVPIEFSGRMLAAEPNAKDKPVMEFIWGSTKTLWEKDSEGKFFPREINMFYHKPTKITRKHNTLRASLTLSPIAKESEEFKAIFNPDLFGLLIPPIKVN